MALQLKNHQTKILPDRNSKQTHSSSSTPGGIKSKDFLCFPGGKCKVKPISSHVRDLIYLHFHEIIKSCFLLSPTRSPQHFFAEPVVSQNPQMENIQFATIWIESFACSSDLSSECFYSKSTFLCFVEQHFEFNTFESDKTIFRGL